jgi:hypothetical protein
MHFWQISFFLAFSHRCTQCNHASNINTLFSVIELRDGTFNALGLLSPSFFAMFQQYLFCLVRAVVGPLDWTGRLEIPSSRIKEYSISQCVSIMFYGRLIAQICQTIASCVVRG